MNIIDTNLSFRSNLSYGNAPDTIVLHHAEASSCSIEDIHRWHLERGWAGCAYHYFVKKDGTIYVGRHEDIIGAHTKVRNKNSIGICAEGMYMTETMPDAQKNAIVELCKDIKNRHSISYIFGHRELMPTSCPGDKYPLNEIKNLINEIKKVPPANVPAKRDWLQVGDSGEKVSYLQKCLISMGFNLGSYGADGQFGKLTKAAVYSFQNALRLNSVEGLAGEETFKAIDEIMSTPTDGVKYAHYEYATRYIQYKVGAPVDGLFGSLTAEYVKSYQKKNSLKPVDGIVGPKTWGKLLNR